MRVTLRVGFLGLTIVALVPLCRLGRRRGRNIVELECFRAYQYSAATDYNEGRA
jgi:hypothetical protein